MAKSVSRILRGNAGKFEILFCYNAFDIESIALEHRMVTPGSSTYDNWILDSIDYYMLELAAGVILT